MIFASLEWTVSTGLSCHSLDICIGICNCISLCIYNCISIKFNFAGLSCHSCNSIYDSRCGDPYDAYTVELVDCEQVMVMVMMVMMMVMMMMMMVMMMVIVVTMMMVTFHSPWTRSIMSR